MLLHKKQLNVSMMVCNAAHVHSNLMGFRYIVFIIFAPLTRRVCQRDLRTCGICHDKKAKYFLAPHGCVEDEGQM